MSQADAFKGLVQNCPVLDITEPVSLDEFFDKTACVLADSLQIPAETLAQMLKEREREYSTVLTTTLAIPHVIIDGSQHFEMLMARSKPGIFFSDKAPAVHTIIVLICTKDQRPLHLRVLATIAGIVQGNDFNKRWLAAPDAATLRKLFL